MMFAEALRIARESLGMSQMAFGKALRISYATINRYENGKHLPTPVFLNAITTYLESKGIQLIFDNSEGERSASDGD